jgi:hypothetical protein
MFFPQRSHCPDVVKLGTFSPPGMVVRFVVVHLSQT